MPAEVALAKFSLKEGLIDTYHCFPYFDFPPGTKGDSKAHSDRNHQIPIFGFSEKLKKWPEIFQEMMRFLAKVILAFVNQFQFTHSLKSIIMLHLLLCS